MWSAVLQVTGLAKPNLPGAAVHPGRNCTTVTLAMSIDQNSAMNSVRRGQHALFALLFLLGSLGVSVMGRWTPVLAVAVLAYAGWYSVGLWLSREYSGRSDVGRVTWQGAAWLVVLIALWFLLLYLDRAYIWTSFSIFLLAMLLLPLPVGLAVVLVMTAATIVTEFSTRVITSPVAAVGGPALGAIVAVGASLGYGVIVRESRERARLIDELTEARDDLVALQDVLARTQREAGALGERARLARDIHDTLAQGFSSIVLLAWAAHARCGGPESAILKQIAETANENLDEARRVVHALAPADLEGSAPFKAALARQLHRLGELTQLQTDLMIDGDPVPLPTPVEVALLRVTQGALSNVRRHSRARRVRITLTFEPDEVRLDVVDDGRGFDLGSVGTKPDGSGFGLRSIRERIAEIGGTVSIESAPGDGTALVATVPLIHPLKEES